MNNQKNTYFGFSFLSNNGIRYGTIYGEKLTSARLGCNESSNQLVSFVPPIDGAITVNVADFFRVRKFQDELKFYLFLIKSTP